MRFGEQDNPEIAESEPDASVSEGITIDLVAAVSESAGADTAVRAVVISAWIWASVGGVDRDGVGGC